ncbi:hypothetical protein HON59_02840 [bacterium]|mgnify:FL=1|nr:hypothetical protein [bacterium]MBT4894968.1 hypothetical protein [bacterium]
MFYSKKLAIVLLITVFSLGIFYPISTHAQMSMLNTPSVFNSSGGGITSFQYNGIKPFGGKITSMKMCTSGIMLEIGPPMGGQYLLTGGTKLHDYGVFAPGVWILGNADTGTVKCKGDGSGASAIGTGLQIAAIAVTLYSMYGANVVFSQAIGDTILSASLAQIGGALGIASIVSKFGFGKKLKTLGHPHPIQIVGTNF